MKKYPKKTIGELCNIIKGETGIASATPGEYPLVVTAKERKTSATYQFDTQAVCIPLVSSSGHGKKSLNYVHYQEGKFALGTILAAIIPKNHYEISAAFLHQYLFFYKDTKIVPLMRGAANVSLAVKDIAKIEVPLPPINQQKDFIIFFNKLQKFNQELIREFDNQQKYIYQLKQAILQEAISGQLTAEWRKQNPMQKGNPDTDAAALLTKIKAEKQQLIADGKLKKEKPLPEIDFFSLYKLPNNWQWIKLGDIVESLRYGTSQKCSYSKDGFPVLRIPNLKNGVIDKSDLKYTLMSALEIEGYSLRNRDILMIRSNGSKSLVGRTSIVSSDCEGYAYAGYLVRLRFIQDLLISRFLYLVFESKFVRDQIEIPVRTTTGVKNINSTEILNLIIPLPPLAEQKAIVEKVDYLMKIIDQLEAQIKHRKQLAEDLMQTVLREAFE